MHTHASPTATFFILCGAAKSKAFLSVHAKRYEISVHDIGHYQTLVSLPGGFKILRNFLWMFSCNILQNHSRHIQALKKTNLCFCNC